MDGVHQEQNINDNLCDVWSDVFSEVEAAADNFINGRPIGRYCFVRVGGVSALVLITTDANLLSWIGGILKRIYTP